MRTHGQSVAHEARLVCYFKALCTWLEGYLERQDGLYKFRHEYEAREIVSVEHCKALHDVRETVGEAVKTFVCGVVDHFLRTDLRQNRMKIATGRGLTIT